LIPGNDYGNGNSGESNNSGGNSDSSGNVISGASDTAGVTDRPGANTGGVSEFGANSTANIGADSDAVGAVGAVPGADSGATDTNNTAADTAPGQPEGEGGSMAETAAPIQGMPQDVGGSAVNGDANDTENETDGSPEIYSIDYDGAGPFEIRIDIPMEEFRALYFDGALWTRGVDYDVRSGSTVLIIPETRLEKVPEDSHRISAVFENQTVNIDFVLQKTSSNGTFVPITESGPVADRAAKKGFPSVPFLLTAGLVLLAGGLAFLRTRLSRA
jgi:hypothetical protein